MQSERVQLLQRNWGGAGCGRPRRGRSSFYTSAAALSLTYANGRFPPVGGTNMKRIKLAHRVGRLGWMFAAALIGAAWVSSRTSAQTLNTLVTFGGSNAAIPEDRGHLIADAHGNLFGTTGLGRASSACTGGCGTVFEIKVDSTTATGYASTPTTLASFNATDGAHPIEGLIADARGTLS